tara:strand:+ start:47881 stop:49002 length:1122 start_codon:yes stop_codon:yes gene_type:complete
MTKPDRRISLNDYAYMKMALDLSRRGLGTVHPNPSVGCVIVKDGHIIGRGWTGRGGRPHAEAIALERAINAEGATAYVTLEPCAHHGKTPPCAAALVSAGVAEVIIATNDPDPRVSGDGIKILQEAGICVHCGLMKSQADLIHQGFFNRIELNRPLVTVKIASSADGKIAKNKGEKTWVTSPESRMRGHMYRANHDAILVGIGTVLVDDPTLDCRISGLEDRSPIRVVIDTHLRIDPASKLCKSADKIPLWIMTASFDEQKYAEITKTGARIFCLEQDVDGQVDLQQAMTSLAGEGITRLLCEGGGKLNASLIRASLVDRLIWFKSADSIGGNGVNALYDIALDELDQYLNLSLLEEGHSGPDHWQYFESFNG